MTIKRGLWQIVHGRESGLMLVLFISISETQLEQQTMSLLDFTLEILSDGYRGTSLSSRNEEKGIKNQGLSSSAKNNVFVGASVPTGRSVAQAVTSFMPT